MAVFEVDWVPGDNIILARILRGFKVRADLPRASERLSHLLESASQPVPYILDLTEVQITFSEMVIAMGELTQGELAVWRHPKIKEIIIVSNQPILKLAAESLRQTQYGKLRAAVFHQLDEALRYLRAKRNLLAALHSNN